MATYVRTHVKGTAGEFAGSASTVAANTSAVVAPGNTLIVVLSGGENRTVSSLTKPGDETASWVQVSADPVTSATVFVEIWAIKTTVAWSAAFTITATLSGACTGRAITIAEWTGVSTTVVDAETLRSALASELLVTAEGVVPGDLVIRAGAVYSGTQPFYRLTSGDGGTVTGTVTGFDAQRPGYSIETNILALDITGAGDATYTPRALYVYSGGSSPVNLPLVGAIVGLESDDYPPDVPTLTTMTSGTTIDRSRANRAAHTFSSDNYSDHQSKFDLRYREVGDIAWIDTITVVTTNTFYDFAGGDLPAGDYERQVLTYGALGKPAPDWSASGFFTAADPTAGPTITYPVDGQDLDQFETATWSSPAQDSYQLRRVADDAGDPDPDTIYFDTGEVTEPSTRALALNFSVNNRAEHIQLRVKFDDLWSEWDDVGANVDYTPPPAPSLAMHTDEVNGSLLVVITNPDPEGDDPAAVSNNVWIDDGKGKGLERRATGVSTNGSWLYSTPVGGRDYSLPARLVIEAVAANGITSRSES